MRKFSVSSASSLSPVNHRHYFSSEFNGDGAVDDDGDDNDNEDENDNEKEPSMEYHQPYLRHGSHHAEASSLSFESTEEQGRRPFFVIRNNPPESHSSALSTKKVELLGVKTDLKKKKRRRKKKQFGTNDDYDDEHDENNETNNTDVVLNSKKREGRGGAWKNRSSNGTNDVIRVPSTGCDEEDDDDDGYYYWEGREHGQGFCRRKRKRRRGRTKKGRTKTDQSFNAAPHIGPSATTAFPRGFSDGRVLESRQRRREEEDEGVCTSYNNQRLPLSLLSRGRRRSRAPLENVVRVVDEGNGLFLLRLINDKDEKQEEMTTFAFQKGLTGRESDLLYLAKRSWEHLSAYAFLVGKTVPSKSPFLDHHDDDDNDNDEKKEHDYNISSFVPVTEDIRDIIDSTIPIEHIFHWNVIQDARKQGEIDLGTTRNLIRDVQANVPLFITSKDGEILSHKTHIFSFNQFVGLACAVEKYLEDIANSPAELWGQILDVTHCSVKVLVRSNIVPCDVVVAVAPLGSGPPPQPSDLCKGGDWCKKKYHHSSSPLMNAQSCGRIDTLEKKYDKGIADFKDDDSDNEDGDSDEDDDSTNSSDVESNSVVIEVSSLSFDSDYNVFLYGERLAKNGATIIKSSSDDIYRTRLQIKTKAGPEPALFPSWESMDKESQRTELLAVSKDRQIQSRALQTGLDITVVNTMGILDDLQREKQGSPWVKFEEWWRSNPDLRADFCERELRHASRDEAIRSAAAEDGITVRQGDWNARCPEKLRRWKNFCWWYHDIIPIQSTKESTEKKDKYNQSFLKKGVRGYDSESSLSRHLDGGLDSHVPSLDHIEHNFVNFDFSGAGSPSHLKGLHLAMRTTTKARDGAGVHPKAANPECDQIGILGVFPSIQPAEPNKSITLAHHSSVQRDLQRKEIGSNLKETYKPLPTLKKSSVDMTIDDVQLQHSSNKNIYDLKVMGRASFSENSMIESDPKFTKKNSNSSDLPCLGDSQINLDCNIVEPKVTKKIMDGQEVPCNREDLSETVIFVTGSIEEEGEALLHDVIPLSNQRRFSENDCEANTGNDHVPSLEVATGENHAVIQGQQVMKRKSVAWQSLARSKDSEFGGSRKEQLHSMGVNLYTNYSGDEDSCDDEHVNIVKVASDDTGGTCSCDNLHKNCVERGGSNNATDLSTELTEEQICFDGEGLKCEDSAGQGVLRQERDRTTILSPKTACSFTQHNKESIKKDQSHSISTVQAPKRRASRGMRNKYLGSRLSKIDTAVSKVENMINFTNEAKKLKGIALFRAKARIISITQKLNLLQQNLQRPATEASDIANLDLFEDFDGTQFDIEEGEDDKKSTLPASSKEYVKGDKVDTKSNVKTKSLKELSRTAKKAYRLWLLRRCFAALKRWLKEEKTRAEEDERIRKQYEAACRTNTLRVLRKCFGALSEWMLLQKQKSEEEERSRSLFDKASIADRIRLLRKAFDMFVLARSLSAKTIPVEEVEDKTELVDLELERLNKESSMFALEDHRSWHYRAFSNALHCRNEPGNPLDHKYSFFCPTSFDRVLNTLHDLRYQGFTTIKIPKEDARRGHAKKDNRKRTTKQIDIRLASKSCTSVTAIGIFGKNTSDTQSENNKTSLLLATQRPTPTVDDVSQNMVEAVDTSSVDIVFVNKKKQHVLRSKVDSLSWRSWQYEEYASKERWLMADAEKNFRCVVDKEMATKREEISCFEREDCLSRFREEREKRVKEIWLEREKTFGSNIVDISWKKRIMWKGPRKRNFLQKYKNMHLPFNRDDFLTEQLSVPEADVYLLERSTKRFMAMMGFPLWSLPYSWNALLTFTPNTQGSGIDNEDSYGMADRSTSFLEEGIGNNMVNYLPTQHRSRNILFPNPSFPNEIRSCTILSSSYNITSPDIGPKPSAEYSMPILGEKQNPPGDKRSLGYCCSFEDELSEKPFERKHLKGHLIMGTALLN